MNFLKGAARSYIHLHFFSTHCWPTLKFEYFTHFSFISCCPIGWLPLWIYQWTVKHIFIFITDCKNVLLVYAFFNTRTAKMNLLEKWGAMFVMFCSYFKWLTMVSGYILFCHNGLVFLTLFKYIHGPTDVFKYFSYYLYCFRTSRESPIST